MRILPRSAATVIAIATEIGTVGVTVGTTIRTGGETAPSIVETGTMITIVAPVGMVGTETGDGRATEVAID